MRVLARKPIHISWVIAISCISIFGGIALAPLLEWRGVTGVAWLLTGSGLVLAAYVYQRFVWVLAAIFGGLIIGLWRGTIASQALVAYEPLFGNVLTISGVVSEDGDLDKHDNTTLRLNHVMYQDIALPASVWVGLSGREETIQRSDRVTVRAEINEGFGTFGASLYRAEVLHVERSEPGDVALKIRNWFADAIRKVIPEPESSLGIGYLVGQRRALPPELDEALKIAGLTHVVVASGYNLTILIRFARRLFARVSKYLAAFTSGGLIVSFIAVTGMSPSMSRAGLVAGLALFTWYYGRKFHPIVLLSIAIAATTLINPSYAWGDVGWQLSFAAFGGVMILAPLLQAYYFGPKKPGTLRQILGETIAATLMTMPILLLTFGYISNVAILANALILPLVPLAMLLVFVSGMSALLLPFLAMFIAFPAYLLLSYMTQTAFHLSSLPWAKTEIEITALSVIGMYSCLALFMVYLWWRTRLNLRDTNIIE